MANLRTNNLFGESGKDPNGSALFDGSGHLTAANASAFRINYGTTEDYTLEAWIFLKEAPSGNARIASIYHTSGNQRSYMFYVSSSLELKYNYTGSASGGAGSVSTLNAGVVPLNEWVHVAVSHDTNTTTLRIYKNGLEKATDNSPSATYFQNTSGDFVIGQDFPSGFISNLHIARGTCKYKTDFTPYREPIEEISDTTVLCCNSSVDVLSDDKSNTFTQSVDGAVEVSSFIPFDRADSGNVFNGPIKHNTQGYMYFPTGRTEERGRGRGLIVANYIQPANYNTCEFITIQSMGNSIDFGDAAAAVRGQATLASSTRAVSGSGYVAPSVTKAMEFFTIATRGNSTSFGTIQGPGGDYTPISNETRGIFAGGYAYPNMFNAIDFITIATQGNSQDFGDMTTNRANGNRSAINSSTRGLIGGGYISPAGSNNIEFLTIATTGNSQDFGDLTSGRGNFTGLCSSTRGVFAGGSNPNNNIIDFVTIASAGNASDFGDMFTGNTVASCSTSNNIRGVIMGGDLQPSNAFTNTMQHVTIATTGNAQDFGDMLTTGAYRNATSDSHGGLS